jgi:hypothetical protein
MFYKVVPYDLNQEFNELSLVPSGFKLTEIWPFESLPDSIKVTRFIQLHLNPEFGKNSISEFNFYTKTKISLF